MIFEILIIVAAAAIFIILARRLPESGDTPSQDLDSLTGFKLGQKMSQFVALPKIKLPNFSKKKTSPKLLPHDPLFTPSQEELMVEAKELVQSGSLKSAEQIYLQLAAKDPGNAKIYSNLGTIYLQLKNYGDARDAFLEALRIDDTVALRHYNLGLAYIGLKTNEKAKVSLKKAIQLSPGKTKYVETLEKIK